MEQKALLSNIQNQIKKLVDQLRELEENKDDFEKEEYE